MKQDQDQRTGETDGARTRLPNIGTHYTRKHHTNPHCIPSDSERRTELYIKSDLDQGRDSKGRPVGGRLKSKADAFGDGLGTGCRHYRYE